jgi:hypothetical protein
LAAQADNLRAGDLPHSWTKEALGTGPNVVRDSLNSCVLSVSSSPTPAASAVSSNFLQQSTGQEVGSQVQVFSRTKEATTSAKNAASSTVSGCMTPSIKTGLQSTLAKTETLQNVLVKSVPPIGSVPHGFAQLAAVLVSFPGKNEKVQSTTIYVEVVGFTSAKALVEVEFENAGSPPPASVVSPTMEALVKRSGAK